MLNKAENREDQRFWQMRNKKGLGPFTLPEIVLYILSAVAMLIFILVLKGYAGSTVPKMIIPNEGQMLANNMADALLSLPNWDGECGCLAKSTITPEGEVIHPGLIPTWKLDALDTTDCQGNHYFCTVPYFIDQSNGAYTYLGVEDLETGKLWHTASTDTIASKPNMSVTRLVGVEYGNGKVHAGKLTLVVYT